MLTELLKVFFFIKTFEKMWKLNVTLTLKSVLHSNIFAFSCVNLSPI